MAWELRSDRGTTGRAPRKLEEQIITEEKMITIQINSIRKYLSFAIAIAGVLILGQGVARADEIFIAGFTNGCFGALCAPGATATSGGLTFSNSTFQGTTANGFRALGGTANPGANFNNLGSISLSTA